MRSEKQIQASRINGAKSRGPVTAAGRFNSANPDPRKRLLANTVLAKNESRQRFDEIHHAMVEEFQPTSHLEIFLVNKMVAAQWRQMRHWSIEKDAVNQHLLMPADAGASETRYDRLFDRALSTLQRLRKVKATGNPTEPKPDPR